MTVIYSKLLTEIKSVFDSIKTVKQVLMHPVGPEDITSYPAVVVEPMSFSNEYSSTVQNKKTYRFKVWLIVPLDTFSKTVVFGEIIPKCVDDVLEKFDKGWDFGTIDGSRIWSLMNTGEFGISKGESGEEAYIEMELLIKMMTNET